MKEDLTLSRYAPEDPFLPYFQELRTRIYGTSPLPQVNANYLAAAFVVFRQGQALGCLCLYYNEHLSHQGRSVWLVGNFDCIDDSGVAGILLNGAASEARAAGAGYLAGPMNGSTWEDYRLPLGKEEPAFTGDLYCPAYYLPLLTTAGFSIWHRYYSTLVSLDQWTENTADAAAWPDLRIRCADREHFREELEQIYILSSAAFADNVLFSPISREAFVARYLRYAAVLDSRFVLLAEDNEGLLAFVFCYPDHMPETKTLVLKTIARHPDRKRKGLRDLLLQQLYTKAKAAGYTSLVHAFMEEDNRSYVLSGRYGGTALRSYVLMLKSLRS